MKIIYRLYLTSFWILFVVSLFSLYTSLNNYLSNEKNFNLLSKYLENQLGQPLNQDHSEFDFLTDKELEILANPESKLKQIQIYQKVITKMQLFKCFEENLKIKGNTLYHCTKDSNIPDDIRISNYDKIGGTINDFEMFILAIFLLIFLTLLRYWTSWIYTGKFDKKFP